MTETILRMGATEQAPRISRSHLGDLKEQLGPRFDDVLLVVSELVSNSVRHTERSDEVLLMVRSSNGSIRIEVSDNGPCFDWNGPRDDGMGLNIVEKIADDCGVTKDKMCTVWVDIHGDQD